MQLKGSQVPGLYQGDEGGGYTDDDGCLALPLEAALVACALRTFEMPFYLTNHWSGA